MWESRSSPRPGRRSTRHGYSSRKQKVLSAQSSEMASMPRADCAQRPQTLDADGSVHHMPARVAMTTRSRFFPSHEWARLCTASSPAPHFKHKQTCLRAWDFQKSCNPSLASFSKHHDADHVQAQQIVDRPSFWGEGGGGRVRSTNCIKHCLPYVPVGQGKKQFIQVNYRNPSDDEA